MRQAQEPLKAGPRHACMLVQATCCCSALQSMPADCHSARSSCPTAAMVPTWVAGHMPLLQEQQQGCALNASSPQHVLQVSPEGRSIKHPAPNSDSMHTHSSSLTISPRPATWYGVLLYKTAITEHMTQVHKPIAARQLWVQPRA